MDMSLSKLWEMVKDREAWHAVHGITKSWTRLSSSTTTTKHIYGFPGVSVLKNLPPNQATQETQIQSLHREDPLEQKMVTNSSILAWKFYGQRSLMGYSRWGHKESQMTEHTHMQSYAHMHTYTNMHTHTCTYLQPSSRAQM